MNNSKKSQMGSMISWAVTTVMTFIILIFFIGIASLGLLSKSETNKKPEIKFADLDSLEGLEQQRDIYEFYLTKTYSKSNIEHTIAYSNNPSKYVPRFEEIYQKYLNWKYELGGEYFLENYGTNKNIIDIYLTIKYNGKDSDEMYSGEWRNRMGYIQDSLKGDIKNEKKKTK